jgi:hypothetical protein
VGRFGRASWLRGTYLADDRQTWQYIYILFGVGGSKIRDKIVGLHDATRLATLHNSAMPGPLTPRHKGTVCGDDLSYLIGGSVVVGSSTSAN